MSSGERLAENRNGVKADGIRFVSVEEDNKNNSSDRTFRCLDHVLFLLKPPRRRRFYIRRIILIT